MKHQHKFTLKHDKVDPRDFKVSAKRLAAIGPLPSSVDLRPVSPPIYNQGRVGLCFAHAGCRCFDMEFYRHTQKFETPSRLFLGIVTRNDEGTLNQDAGATMRGTCKAMVKYGIPPESSMPYETSKMFQMPPQQLIVEAEKYQTTSYYSIPAGNIDMVKQAVAGGFAVMFGAAIYASFESQEISKTGMVSMPKANEQSLGGHALTVVGYDEAKQAFLVANSWGEEWGLAGYCWMPYDYFSALVWDLWVVTDTEIGE